MAPSIVCAKLQAKVPNIETVYAKLQSVVARCCQIVDRSEAGGAIDQALSWPAGKLTAANPISIDKAVKVLAT